MNRFILLLTFIYFIVTSCTTEKKDAKIGTTKVQFDSISLWVKQSRDDNYKITERRELLDKAFQETSELDNDSLKMKYLSRISLSHLRLKDSFLFRETNRMTLQLAKSNIDSIVQAEAHWDLAEFFRENVIQDSAYYHFSRAQEIFELSDDDYRNALMLLNMALTQGDVKDNTGSEITTIRAIELLKPLNKRKQLYKAYNNLGVISSNLKEYERAIEYYNMALEYQDENNGQNTLYLNTMNNIGTIYLDKGAYTEAIPYFEKILKSKNIEADNKELYAIALNNLAYAKFKSGNFSNVEKELLESLAIRDSIGDLSGISNSFYSLAEYYLTKQDTVNAVSQTNKALMFSELANNNERVLQTLLLLAKIEPKKSSFYNQKYIILNDSLQQEERKIRDKFARIRFETDEYIAENVILTSEKQLWAGIALAIFLLGGAALIIFDQRSKNQKLRFQQQQQASNQEIFNLMLAQNQKEEEGKKSEQKRISEELHDGVLGKMMGARMVLTGLNKKSDNEAEVQREKAINALQDVEKEVRSISHELSHAAYQKIHNFILSLKDLLKTIESTGSIDCHFIYDNEKDWDALKGDVKINVYRMVQESLQNSIKHAQCNTVTVTFAIQEDILMVTIADDGKGFRKTKGKKGIGMRNIASRTDKLNGEWHIDTSPGKGTTVRLEIPIPCSEITTSKTKGNRQLVQEA